MRVAVGQVWRNLHYKEKTYTVLALGEEYVSKAADPKLLWRKILVLAESGEVDILLDIWLLHGSYKLIADEPAAIL